METQELTDFRLSDFQLSDTFAPKGDGNTKLLVKIDRSIFFPIPLPRKGIKIIELSFLNPKIKPYKKQSYSFHILHHSQQPPWNKFPGLYTKSSKED